MTNLAKVVRSLNETLALLLLEYCLYYEYLVIIYDSRGYIRLATGLFPFKPCSLMVAFSLQNKGVFTYILK